MTRLNGADLTSVIHLPDLGGCCERDENALVLRKAHRADAWSDGSVLESLSGAQRLPDGLNLKLRRSYILVKALLLSNVYSPKKEPTGGKGKGGRSKSGIGKGKAAGGGRYRSAVTGKYVRAKYGTSHPNTTVKESK